MVECVQELPPKLQVPRFGKVKILRQRRIHVPEPRSATFGTIRTFVPELPPRIVGVVVERRPVGIDAGSQGLDNTRVATEGGLEGRWIPPLVFTCGFVAAA